MYVRGREVPATSSETVAAISARSLMEELYTPLATLAVTFTLCDTAFVRSVSLSSASRRHAIVDVTRASMHMLFVGYLQGFGTLAMFCIQILPGYPDTRIQDSGLAGMMAYIGPTIAHNLVVPLVQARRVDASIQRTFEQAQAHMR